MTKLKTSKLLLPLVLGVAALSGGCQSTRKDPPVLRRAHVPKAAADEYPMIVRLVGRHYSVTASSGPHGVVYSAAGADGRAIVANASLDELRRQYPEIYQQLIPGIAEEGEGSNSNRRSASDAQDAVPTADRHGPRADVVMLMSAE